MRFPAGQSVATDALMVPVNWRAPGFFIGRATRLLMDKEKPSEILAQGREIEREYWDGVFKHAKTDPYLSDAMDMIRHLHDCIADGTQPTKYAAMLAGWLHAHDKMLAHYDEFAQVVTSENIRSIWRKPKK